MKKVLLTLVVILCAFTTKAQCWAGTISGPGVVTPGQTITLSDSGGYAVVGGVYTPTTSGGTWTSSNTSIATIDPLTGVVSGVTLGTVNITYTMAPPCGTTYAVRSINVAAGFTGRRQICVGDVSSFTVGITGGTWSSADPSIASINSVTGAITGMSPGTAHISYTFTLGGVTAATTDTVAVRNVTSVGPITSYMPAMCVGSIASLSNSGPDPVTWRSTDTAVVRISEYATNPYTATTYAYGAGTSWIVFSSAYCQSVKDSTIVTVNPSPLAGTINGAIGSLCVGAVVSLTVTGSTGTSGIWYSSSPSDATVSSSGVVSTSTTHPITVQIYYVASNSFGCNAQTNTYLVTNASVISTSIVGAATAHVGATENYYSAWYMPGTATYWAVSDPTKATISSTGVVTGLAVGTVNLTLTIIGCGSTVATRTITVAPAVVGGTATTFTGFTNTNCTLPAMGVVLSAHTATYQVASYFGDGTSAITTIAPATATTITPFTHVYATSGMYSIKDVLLSGGLPIDSVTYSYQHLLCRDLSVVFYTDANSNCTYDVGTENFNFGSLLVEIDSNGTPVDTIPATSGFYYHTLAAAGDVFGFRLLPSAASLSFACPIGGVVTETITASSPSIIYIPVTCSSTSGFELYVNTSLTAGRHMAGGTIVAGNNTCNPQNGTVTLNISPKYVFSSSYPTPSSITSSTATWNLTNLTASDGGQFIVYYLQLATPTTPWLIPGDTVHTTISITPTTGDNDPSNNSVIRVDTVRSSYDPNTVTVIPSGNILSGTKLNYSITFENDGNDTAHNIYVMDTLSDNLNVSTLQLLGASAVMNTTVLHDGGHNILRFEFPHIMLPDSSHHNRCTGTLSYSIKTLTPLADGTDIVARAGIYFDDNEVVMTDKAFNKIVVPNISITAVGGASICLGSTVHFVATPHSLSNPHFQWYLNGATTGTDSVEYTRPAAAVGDVVKCVMTTTMDETIISNSNTITLNGGGLPSAGTITGLSLACIGAADVVLTESLTTGTWSASNSHATIVGGTVHALTVGVDTIYYSVTNSCGTARASHEVTINTLPVAGTITGGTFVCQGESITLASTTTGGTWSLSNSHATHAGAIITGASVGTDTAVYTVTNTCGTATSRMAISIPATVTPSIATAISPNDTVCSGLAVTLTSTITNGGTTPAYRWKRFGVVIGTGASLSYMPTLGDVVTCTMVSSAQCPSVDSVISASTTMMVIPTVTPSSSIISSVGDSISHVGESVTFNSTVSYCASATYQWYNNGVLIPGATSTSYTTTLSGDGTFYCVNQCSNQCSTTNTDTSNTVKIYGDYLTTDVHGLNAANSTLSLYPNPNQGSFQLRGTTGNLTNETVRFDILDISGKVIYSGSTTPKNGIIHEQVDMANMASGQYILRVVTSNNVQLIQFVMAR